MGPDSMPGVEWKSTDAKGRNYAYDSQEEALAELHEYGLRPGDACPGRSEPG
ncbi:hypothetical protein [Kitasatospora aureofaciens]|uniref:hypothetical protein n=1 Tax=Kitasatospora aureofaciens TaxID=1894 RepID=UPI0038130224